MKKSTNLTAALSIMLVLICSSYYVSAQSWNLVGNSATNPSNNFIGTTDLQPLKFRINNVPAGELNPINGNTALGINTLFSNTIGTGNVAIGTNALYHNIRVRNLVAIGDSALFSYNTSNPIGSNTAIGSKALLSATGAYRSTAIGFQALYSDIKGYDNTAIGSQALYSNTTVSNITGRYNTAIGSKALYANTSGISNSANGAYALTANTIGSYNTGSGSYVLFQNTTGSGNTANGAFALYSNNTGVNNTANGDHSLYLNTTGYNNTANGVQALYSNTTGFQNTANGVQALHNNSEGYSNTAIGYQALYFNAGQADANESVNNTATGYQALYGNTKGSYNTANGISALSANTTGGANTAIGAFSLISNTSGGSNTANGNMALFHNTTGGGNTANGNSALFQNLTGYNNTANGSQALNNNADGFQNTALGYSAGSALNSDNCTYVGYDANYNGIGLFTVSNSTAVGAGSRVTSNNQVRIGSSTVSSIGGFQNWSNISDGRYKTAIKENVPGLAFINKLKAITYHLDVTGIKTFLGEDITIEQGKKVIKEKSAEDKAMEEKSVKAKEQVVYTGFIAQDVEKAAKELNYDFSGIDKPQNENTLYGLRYAEFVVPLVKAVQELSIQNDAKDSIINNLQQQINELKTMVQSITKSTTTNPANTTTLSGASLEQNIPNPFNQSTTIHYTLPSKFVSAQIIITDQTGKVLKQQSLSTTGKGILNVQAGSLAAGTYSYSLFIDNHLLDTKKMVLIK